MNTPVGFVPQVGVRLSKRDKLQTVLTRLGIIRNDYTVAPGLYCVGSPDGDSPVLVTANYKLSFDSLRKELNSTDAWILVLDTRGINVWCAAGKGLFSHTELIRQVHLSRLESVVNHRELILPQLGATGVSARQVKSGSGFRCVWGPVRAEDIPAFLENGRKGEPAMRRVSFSLKERVELIPVEFTNLGKMTLIILALSFVLSGIGPGIYSLSAAWSRGLPAAWSFVAGALIGTVAVPVLLPLIPGKAFALKGGLAGIVFGGAFLLAGPWLLSSFEYLALFLWILVISSFLAMNFTGSTPYTSPSGVEKEMKRAMPLQGAGLVLSLIFWIGAGFLG
ncbi:MAG: hypothetical protein K9K64_10265 [Desulfohalobiaceae bacterium]|nr:hypothetical protein [Desulfohalobiaceae bacterium]